MDHLDLLPSPVLVTDARGHILTANSDLLALVGGVAEQWRGRYLDCLLPAPSRIFLQTHVWPLMLRHGAVQELYLHLHNAAGERVPVMVNGRRGLWDEQDCIFWVFFVALERSRFEAELVEARGRAQRLAAELSQANAELRSVHHQLSQHTQSIESENRELSALSLTDPLTRLGNRRALERAVAQWQAQSEPGATAALLMVDVDHFKRVNDKYGHEEGDRVLQELAHQLQASKRASDVVVRYGGEEFALWLPDAGPEGAGAIAQRVHQLMKNVTVHKKPVTVSIGVSCAQQTLLHGQDSVLLTRLLHEADVALYRAKSTGRNRTEWYNDVPSRS
ncbi:sensor domain-containing diguanylate cyclase [Rhodoferax bucti]|uniref:sensor domain-containing diguanylate cyclase n=1 Tax=Rhodoferax bucti TaxID=2576305 RepID=UPI001107E7A1|nr:sensor domain-containing diguanylate cyclase [Rhodoferax bucti]